MDTTTFYGVNPSTVVTFRVDFNNDFHPATEVAQVFRATIVVLGRALAEVDRRDVFIVVPPDGGEIPPMWGASSRRTSRDHVSERGGTRKIAGAAIATAEARC